jgi:hypothetical protein
MGHSNTGTTNNRTANLWKLLVMCRLYFYFVLKSACAHVMIL